MRPDIVAQFSKRQFCVVLPSYFGSELKFVFLIDITLVTKLIAFWLTSLSSSGVLAVVIWMVSEHGLEVVNVFLSMLMEMDYFFLSLLARFLELQQPVPIFLTRMTPFWWAIISFIIFPICMFYSLVILIILYLLCLFFFYLPRSLSLMLFFLLGLYTFIPFLYNFHLLQ